MNKIGILFFLILISCKYNEFDGKHAAKDYCNCLTEEKDNGKDFFDARTKCDGELLAKNKYFRITYIEDMYGRYMYFLPDGLKDSAVQFKNAFNNYILDNCCKEAVLGCDSIDVFQKNRNLIDSLEK